MSPCNKILEKKSLYKNNSCYNPNDNSSKILYHKCSRRQCPLTEMPIPRFPDLEFSELFFFADAVQHATDKNITQHASHPVWHIHQ